MFAIIKSRWVLLSVLAVFIILKIPHLSCAYYWDESWPYASAVAKMYTHGVSLMPGAIDPELSRGHPLFFHAAAALWGKVFGMSHISMHSFALFVSLLFMIAIYEAGLRIFNNRVAIMALLLVGVQQLFVVQSASLLPEMLVAFLAFISMYHYVRGNYLQTGIYLSMLFLTKESGLMMGFVLGVDALISLRLYTHDTWKKHIARLLSIGVPCMVMGLFFVLQKQINGWYIFPLYNNLIEHRWDNFWYVYSKVTNSVMYINDYRYGYFIIAAILAVYAAVKTKLWYLLAVPLPILLIYFMSGTQGPHGFAGSAAHFSGLLLTMAAATYCLSKPSLFPLPTQRQFIRLLMAFINCFLIFSSMNFFIDRYLLAVIVPSLFLVAVVVDKMSEQTQPRLYIAALAGMMAISTYAYLHDDGMGNSYRGTFRNMELQQRSVDYLEQNNLYDKVIGTSSFLQKVHLTDPATGFLRGKKVFKNVGWEVVNADYIVVDNIEADTRYEQIKKMAGYKLVFRKEIGGNWVEVYHLCEQ